VDVIDSSKFPFGGAGDSQAGGLTLSGRFRRHADSLVRSHRSPVCVELMRGAADDIDRGGEVATLFDGIPTPPGSVPQLRLLGALHRIVLSGEAPELAAFYPSAGGSRGAGGVWPVALATIHEHRDEVRARLGRTVQTNEPGRSAVLFAGLLWLTERYRRPIRLLEIGASAGLNLHVDRYSYVVGGRQLGDPGSPLRFLEPWRPPPPIDLAATGEALRVIARAGCDLAPLDPTREEDRLTLLSYIWPDELDRIDRLRAALEVAAADPIPVARARASEWLPEAIAAQDDGELTVVWHSVFRQYLEPEEWKALEQVFRGAANGLPDGRLVWLSMEPAHDHAGALQLTLRVGPDEPETTLALCGDHGLPIEWKTG
jgi:hypothetical protein